MRTLTAIFLATMCAAPLARAQDFRIEEVGSVASLDVAQVRPKTVAFTDHRKAELFDPGSGLIRFSDWGRIMPLQQRMLGLYPTFDEPTVTTTIAGVSKTRKLRLHMYVAEARFIVSRPPAAIDVARYATISFLERMDPAIKSQAVTAADSMLLKRPQLAFNRNPERGWCEGPQVAVCLQSRYKLEGRLPLGIMLLNKLRDNDKRVADFVEFQSEVRVLTPADVDEANTRRLAGLDLPVASVLEQTIFWVNQIMQFGKFVAVLQKHPTDADKTVVTAFIALAVDSELLEKKKEYENVPVLRNLVPAQVLSGNSSFNTGNSISAGLPNYARNRIRLIADIIDKDRGAGAAPVAEKK